MWIVRRMAGIVLVAAVSLLLALSAPAGAQDLDCGDPGVGVNFPVGNDDPNGFDGDNDGIGCEVGPGTATSATTAVGGHRTHTTELAHTGSATPLTAAVGLALLAVGTAALLASQRYRPRHLAR